LDKTERQRGMIERYALLKSVLKNVEIGVGEFSLGHDQTSNINSLRSYFQTVSQTIGTALVQGLLDKELEKFGKRYGADFYYEFSDDDIAKIQSLINDLRSQVSNSNLFEENHRQRLLRRLERLQSELHKRLSDLDRFWGFCADASVMLRKFGEDAKPIVNRVRELADIVWESQARAEALPPGSEKEPPLLPKDNV